MPGFDRRGPNGEGPRTGRNMGKCRPLNSDENSGVDASLRTVAEPESSVSSHDVSEETMGLGRGGLPRGCGNGFGGGRRPAQRAARVGRTGRGGRGHGQGRSGFGRRRG